MNNKLLNSNGDLEKTISQLKKQNKKIVFTNGCFDVLHLGHIELLKKCKELGDVNIVGLNSDASVKKLKGETRPINNQHQRSQFLSYLPFVDYIVIFDEETPLNLIKKISPDFLIKGADYLPQNIVGFDFVTSYGGKVLTFDFNINKSSTKIIEAMKADSNKIFQKLSNLKNTIEKLLDDAVFGQAIENVVQMLKNNLKKGAFIYTIGNGGSSEQAKHFATELLGHYKNYNVFYPCICLADDYVNLTALSNDYGFNNVFSKQIETLGKPNDVLFAISTSGSSENILNALKVAKKIGMTTILLTGKNAKNYDFVDYKISVDCEDTATIQELHLVVIHYLAERIKSE